MLFVVRRKRSTMAWECMFNDINATIFISTWAQAKFTWTMPWRELNVAKSWTPLCTIISWINGARKRRVVAVNLSAVIAATMEASQALLRLVNEMTKMDKESFMGAFGLWHERYKDVLNERNHDRRMKTPPYMRPRLRSAYLGIKRNMPWLWTFTIMTTGGYQIQTTESRGCFRTSRPRLGCIAGWPENIERNLSMSIYQDTTDLSHHPFCLTGPLGAQFITHFV